MSPFQTKNGAVLNSAGGFGNNVRRPARESTVAAVAANTNNNAKITLFLIDCSLSSAQQTRTVPTPSSAPSFSILEAIWPTPMRSEEHRVGKEGRSRWAQEY